jgi:hypothetical protein
MSQLLFRVCAVITVLGAVLVLIPHPNTPLWDTMSLVEGYWVIVTLGYAFITFLNLRAAQRSVETAEEPPVSEVEVEVAKEKRFTQAALLALHLFMGAAGVISAVTASTGTGTPRTVQSVAILATLFAAPIGLGIISVELHLRRAKIISLLQQQIKSGGK